MLEWADRRAWTAPSPGWRPAPVAGDAAGEGGRGPAGDGTDRRHAAGRCAGAGDRDPRRQQDAARRSLHRRDHRRTAAAALRSFFRTMTSWHRYLALEGDEPRHRQGDHRRRQLIFLFIVISGMYLWLPRVWTWIQFKNVLWFRTRPRAEGPRLQLAQRHRRLVGDPARDRRGRRGADFVSVGQQSRLPHRRRHTAAASGRGRGSAPAERREPSLTSAAVSMRRGARRRRRFRRGAR